MLEGLFVGSEWDLGLQVTFRSEGSHTGPLVIEILQQVVAAVWGALRGPLLVANAHVDV